MGGFLGFGGTWQRPGKDITAPGPALTVMGSPTAPTPEKTVLAGGGPAAKKPKLKRPAASGSTLLGGTGAY